MVHRLVDDPQSPYRVRVDAIANAEDMGSVYAMEVIAGVLEHLMADAEAGLLGSISAQVQAETFDDFIDHAEAYLREERKDPAGVIAGVVFEDSLRRLARARSIVEKDVPLDLVISGLQGINELSRLQAKRARVGADVRTKATHAQWAEFSRADVQLTIDLVRELTVKLAATSTGAKASTSDTTAKTRCGPGQLEESRGSSPAANWPANAPPSS